MNVLCNLCLCADTVLYPIAETGVYELYSHILNEINVSDASSHATVCSLCRRLLQKWQVFKQQVQESHRRITQCTDYSTILSLSKPSHLQYYTAYNLSYFHTNKSEQDSLTDATPYKMEFNIDVVKTETEDEMHCEPESFVIDLNVDGGGNVKKHRKHSKSKATNNVTDSFSDDDVMADSIKPDSDDEVLSQKRLREEKSCLECDVMFDSPRELRSHVRKKHSKSKKPKLKTKHNPTLADIDNQDVTIDNKPSEHNVERINNDNEKIINNHNGERIKKVYNCDECGEKFDKLKKLKAHAKCEHPKQNGVKKKDTIETKDGKPYCAECKKTFSTNKTYRYHRNVLHGGQNRHPCPRCSNVYQWKSNLARHLRTHKARDSGELYCAACDKRFASVATYSQHVRISRKHVPEEHYNFKCSECDKKFVTKVSLRDHMDWEHLKKIKFRCKLCHKAFKSHTSMYIHTQNVHRKDKKDNLCHVCGKSYQNAAKLKYHIVAMHTLETPYQCAACGAAFGWYSSLYRHVREVHYKMKIQPNRKRKSKKSDIQAVTQTGPA